jgi:hypothetical protein
MPIPQSLVKRRAGGTPSRFYFHSTAWRDSLWCILMTLEQLSKIYNYPIIQLCLYQDPEAGIQSTLSGGRRHFGPAP